ncbi:hypothetical protein GTI81_09040 [Enterococcus faecalis]|uniref:Uncharacterized protein n=1 Tax=Enterococcus faecalis TaxID=1351 RepID=A0AAP6RII7_ENTFL|nr:hypothetical protein [Enterococcus faecalis]MXS28376.1 hypothetical protein [Enterococcus faecalis]MXS52855.1 hypothetical protein [Enterococcus faecalis]
MTPQRTVPKSLNKDAELLRYKLAIEDKIKASPLSELTKQFYSHWAKSLPKNRTEKEADEPP